MIPEDLAHLDEMTRSEGWRVYQDEIRTHHDRIVQSIANHSTPLADVEYLRGQLEGLRLAMRPLSEKP